MRDLIRKTLKDLRKQTSGNAMLLMAIGMPALIGGAGLAVDTAQWYMWKRELQYSVDQAAIAGAWAMSDVDSEANYEVRARQEFNANQSKTASFATTPVITLAGFAGGDDNSVVVSASATKSLPFSSFLTGGGVTVTAIAQAKFDEGAEYNACLVSIKKTGTGIDIGGNATVKARCGLAALSCSTSEDHPAIDIADNAHVETDSIVACGKTNVPEELEIVTNTVGDGVLTDAYALLSPPDNPVAKSYNCATSGSGRNRTTLASLTPGTYQGLVVRCTTTMSPGIYVIDGGELDLSANYNVTGTNVMFVLKNGARLKLGGNGNDNTITLSPMTESNFIGTPYETLADKYAGMLIFEHRDNDVGNPGHIFNGNSNSLIEGAIYLPDGAVTVSGTADVSSQCLLISAYTITIQGDAFLETLCPSNHASSVGHSTAAVRLVN